MAANISNQYSQFYRGTEQIASYGSGAGKKDTLVRYEFNTTDEKGNKVMDKMTKEETFRTMNEISAQYGDNVIVEFSGDALTALEHSGKGFWNPPENPGREVPVQYSEGPHALTEEELESVKGLSERGLTDDMVAIMKDVDPKAYREYQRISKEGIASGTREGMTAGFRYELSWLEKKASQNSKWLEEYKASQKTGADTSVKGSESKLSEKAAAFLKNLRKKYGDYDFLVGNAGDDLRSLTKGSSKEFSVIFSTEELERMASDEKYAQEKMKAVQGAVRMSEQINKQFGFESGVKMTKFAVCFDDNGSVSYFVELEKSTQKQKERVEQIREKRVEEKKEAEKKTKDDRESQGVKKVRLEASSEEELFRKIKYIDWSEPQTGRQQITGSRFDYSI